MRELARIGAFLAAAASLARDFVIAGGGRGMTAITVCCAGLVLTALVTRFEGMLTFAGLGLIAHYGMSLGLARLSADFGVPLTAVLVVLFLELGDIALACHTTTAVDGVFVRAAVRGLVRAGGVGVLVAAAVVFVAELPWPSATLTRALGLVGVALAVAMAYVLLRQPRSRRR
jgi:hypothetical protein